MAKIPGKSSPVPRRMQLVASPRAVTVWLGMVDLCDWETWILDAPREAIASASNCSLSTVKRCIGELEKLGFLEYTHNSEGGESNQYRLVFKPVHPRTGPTGSPMNRFNRSNRVTGEPMGEPVIENATISEFPDKSDEGEGAPFDPDLDDCTPDTGKPEALCREIESAITAIDPKATVVRAPRDAFYNLGVDVQEATDLFRWVCWRPTGRDAFDWSKRDRVHEQIAGGNLTRLAQDLGTVLFSYRADLKLAGPSPPWRANGKSSEADRAAEVKAIADQIRRENANGKR